jgi:hypothetical protein
MLEPKRCALWSSRRHQLGSVSNRQPVPKRADPENAIRSEFSTVDLPAWGCLATKPFDGRHSITGPDGSFGLRPAAVRANQCHLIRFEQSTVSQSSRFHRLAPSEANWRGRSCSV